MVSMNAILVIFQISHNGVYMVRWGFYPSEVGGQILAQVLNLFYLLC
ncbi:hypothetical protein PEPS_37220 (plasmid) [Persicobacter psychrovividus]|uniref:Uncharacterized protein n=1 Tax=Persicobacter psychrovividus TaxID=387638 RepID=A0ABN6LIP7_9BACT|nr:hypothetical protein PEPS_37220 [Persicobacter psychrovividus]